MATIFKGAVVIVNSLAFAPENVIAPIDKFPVPLFCNVKVLVAVNPIFVAPKSVKLVKVGTVFPSVIEIKLPRISISGFTATPDKLKLYGFSLPSLFTIENMAVLVPTLSGESFITNVVCPPAATVALGAVVIENSEALTPVKVIAPKFKIPVPVF